MEIFMEHYMKTLWNEKVYFTPKLNRDVDIRVFK